VPAIRANPKLFGYFLQNTCIFEKRLQSLSRHHPYQSPDQLPSNFPDFLNYRF
jgi:hypothetical protein